MTAKDCIDNVPPSPLPHTPKKNAKAEHHAVWLLGFLLVFKRNANLFPARTSTVRREKHPCNILTNTRTPQQTQTHHSKDNTSEH